MAQAMLLDGDEKDILGSLEVGQAVVKLQGRAPRPFLIQIPEFRIQKGLVRDAALKLRMSHLFFEEPVERAAAGEFNGDSERPPSVPGDGETCKTPVPAAVSDPSPSIDPIILAFLKDVRDRPESGVAARYKRLGISVRQGQKLKARLVEQGHIKDHEERTDTGRLRVVRLTEKGHRAVRNAYSEA